MRTNYTYLMENTDPGEIHYYLYQDKVISQHDYELINAATTCDEKLTLILKKVS